MSLNTQAKTCTATRRDGNPCSNPALRDSGFCRHHTPTKTRRARHFLRDGTFAARLSTHEEQELFERTLDAIERDFALNQSSDRMQAEMAAVYFVKWREALRKGDGGALFQFDELIRKNLGALKMTREKRELPAAEVGTPAEWAARLLSQSKPKETELPEESKTNGTEDQTEIAVEGERWRQGSQIRIAEGRGSLLLRPKTNIIHILLRPRAPVIRSTGLYDLGTGPVGRASRESHYYSKNDDA